MAHDPILRVFIGGKELAFPWTNEDRDAWALIVKLANLAEERGTMDEELQREIDAFDKERTDVP